MDDSFGSAETPPATNDAAPLSLDTPPATAAEAPGAAQIPDADLTLDAPPQTSPAPMDAAVDPALQAQPVPQDMLEGSPNPLDSLVDTQSTAPKDLQDATMMATQNGDDQANNVNLASPVELRQREAALYGFSMGFLMSSAPIREKFDIGKLPGSNVDYQLKPVDSESAAIQSFGVMLRYAVAPFYGLGTDLNVSYSKSQNHHSVTVDTDRLMSEITTLKGELNFTYAIELGEHVPLYFLGGIGAEKVTGSEVERILSPMGYGGQVGAGFAAASTINLEAVYFYYVHRISNNVQEYYATRTTAGTGFVDTEQAQVINQGLLVRGSYSFDF